MSSCLKNALWLPNLVGRIPDQRVMQCWGQRSCKVSWGQPEVKLLTPYGYQTVAEPEPSRVGEPPTRKTKMRKKMKKNWGKMREATGKWGKIEEIILSCPPGGERLVTALLPNVVGRTPDHSIMHCWDQRSCRGQPVSTTGQIVGVW